MVMDSTTTDTNTRNRVIHVSHFLPTICRKSDNPQLPWVSVPRRGHSAMYIAIKSLNSDCDNYHMGDIGTVLDEKNLPIKSGTLTDEDRTTIKESLENDHYLPVFLPENESTSHYEGYCKTELWPAFHYILHDFKVDIGTQKKNWEGYVKVNQRFADAIVQFYKPVWIHDYHLMLVPEMVREKISDAKIGFFLHSPFPSSEIFRCLPTRLNILKGVLCSNLIGFQTYAYARHFSSTCTRVLGLELAPGGIDYRGSLVHVKVYPIGIDVAMSEEQRQSPEVLAKVKSFKEMYPNKKIVFGRDKLDQSTGVLQKFHAFESFLKNYPEWQGKVVLIQVSSSPHSNPDLEKKISEVVGRINNTYGSLEFSPVHHFQHHIAREEYYGLLSIADAGLITSVRDGFNTTSHQFIICQNEKHSPLLLSEFTGTAGSLEGAILVNPFNASGTAEALNRALLMSEEEKAATHAGLYERVTKQDAAHWARSFFSGLQEVCSAHDFSISTPPLDISLLHTSYQNSKKRLLLFDYDGTLTEIRSVPSAAIPTEKMLAGLKRLTEDSSNVVWIISGRDQKALTEWMGEVPRLGLSAEHGCFMKGPDDPQNEWVNLAELINLDWKDDVLEIFTYYTERTQGSFIEHKRASLTWHYRMADPEFGSFQAKECQNHLENAVVCKLPVEILIGKKNIEVRPKAINKGEIVKKLLDQNADCDFVLCAGDDRTDEDMFRALKKIDIPDEKIFSCTIGPASKKTLARWHLEGPDNIIDAIHKMV